MKKINYSIKNKSCLLKCNLFNEQKNQKFVFINNIKEALNYFDKGRFVLIDSDKVDLEVQKSLINLDL